MAGCDDCTTVVFCMDCCGEFVVVEKECEKLVKKEN